MEKAVAVLAVASCLVVLVGFVVWTAYKDLSQRLWERRHAIKRDDQMEDRIYEEEKRNGGN